MKTSLPMKKITTLLLLILILTSAMVFAQNASSEKAKSPNQEAVKLAKVPGNNTFKTSDGLLSISQGKRGGISPNPADYLALRVII
jgi:hypothetical protein